MKKAIFLTILGHWVCTLVSADPGPMRVHFIDAGQGDATLVEFPCGTMLIDTGGEATRWTEGPYSKVHGGANAVVGYLQGFFSSRPDRRLDLLVLTHPHVDHTSGIPNVLRQFRPKKIVYNGQASRTEQERLKRFVEEHADVEGWYVLESTIPDGEGLTNEIIDPIACSGIDPEIRVLWGQAERDDHWHRREFDEENNHSVVLRIDYGESSILFTGDLEESERNRKAGIERLLEKYEGTRLLDVDVYQVGHHGSANGNTDELTAAMSPEIAVLSHGPACSKRRGFSAWGHRHPRKQTIDELLECRTEDDESCLAERETVGAQFYDTQERRWRSELMTKAIYSTGWDGTIILEADIHGTWKLALTSGPDACVFDL